PVLAGRDRPRRFLCGPRQMAEEGMNRRSEENPAARRWPRAAGRQRRMTTDKGPAARGEGAARLFTTQGADMVHKYACIAALLLVLLVGGPAPASATDAQPEAAANASEEGMTFAQEFDQACRKYSLALLEVEKIMKEIKKIYADDPETLRRIIKAQTAWETYRRSHVDALYHGGPGAFGSASVYCNCVNMLPVVELRLQQLRYWRDGTVEGDVCAGHVKWLQKE
ncbi:MAG: hypothetical protein AB7D57_02690, partial [Desulfovibrionaceae bacterium]